MLASVSVVAICAPVRNPSASAGAPRGRCKAVDIGDFAESLLWRHAQNSWHVVQQLAIENGLTPKAKSNLMTAGSGETIERSDLRDREPQLETRHNGLRGSRAFGECALGKPGTRSCRAQHSGEPGNAGHDS